ncbi:MAG: histidine phosphatase family protein [Gemmatimonadota bacterium]
MRDRITGFGKSRNQQAMWLLRVGLAACFIGHGAFGLIGKTAWLPYFALFGIDGELAQRLMPMVGAVDIAVGLLALFRPTPALLVYAAVWTLFTALLRPVSGEGPAEALERAGNYGLPIVLLTLAGLPGKSGWFRPLMASSAASNGLRAARVAGLLTGVLLAGHGLLAIAGKPLLLGHMSLVGFPPAWMSWFGTAELLLALACWFAPSQPLFFGIVFWKLASESLFLFQGAPVWEFIERGGSYVVPLIAGLLVTRTKPAAAVPRRVISVARAIAVISALAPLPVRLNAQQPLPRASPEVVAEVRAGGFVVACRHAITDHAREDRHPVDFSKPETQRVLSQAGEKQAADLGAALKRLGLPFSDVRSSPYQRTFLSAELMFGAVKADSAFYGSNADKKKKVIAFLSEPAVAGVNRAMVTHQGVLYPLFPMMPNGSIAEGDCILVRPGGTEYTAVAHVKPEDWK